MILTFYMGFIIDLNYSIIIVTIVNLLVGFAILAKSQNSNKILTNLIFGQFILGVCLAIISGIDNKSNSETQTQIKDTVDVNSSLSREIKRLQEINDKIVSNIQTVSQQNKTLTEEIKKIANSSRWLINKIDSTTIRQFESNTLTGSIDFTFDRPVNSLKDITLLMGNIPRIATEYPLPYQLKLGNEPGYSFTNPIRLQVINKKLVLNVKIIDPNNNYLFEIRDNSWIVNPRIKNRLNYDNKGVEVIDDKNNILFSLDILSNNTIKIQAWYPTTPNSIRIIGDKYVVTLGYGSLEDNLNGYFKQLFEYTGNNWLHKRVKN